MTAAVFGLISTALYLAVGVGVLVGFVVILIATLSLAAGGRR